MQVDQYNVGAIAQISKELEILQKLKLTAFKSLPACVYTSLTIMFYVHENPLILK